MTRRRPLPGSHHRTTHRGTYRIARVLGSLLAVALLLLLGLLLFHGRRGEDWVPAPEETSTRFLDREVDDALTALQQARDALGEDPAGAERSLEQATGSLLRLRDYYLPLLEARQLAENTLRWYRIGDLPASRSELAALEELLLQIAARGGPGISREIAPSLKAVVDARIALQSDRADAAEQLGGLAARINLLLLKGDLALHGSDLEDG